MPDRVMKKCKKIQETQQYLVFKDNSCFGYGRYDSKPILYGIL